MIGIFGGGFQFPNGAVVASGTLTLQLSWDSPEAVTTPGGIVVSAERISYTLDLTGNLPLTYIWSNAELSVPTYYIVNLYDKNGVPVFKAPFIWVFTTPTGGTIDIGTPPNQGGEGGSTYEPIEGPTGPTGPTGPPGAASAGGGVSSSGGVSSTPGEQGPPIVVQRAYGGWIDNAAHDVVLSQAPSVGNILVAMVMDADYYNIVSHLPTGFTVLSTFANNPSGHQYGDLAAGGFNIGYRVVKAGDGTHWSYQSTGWTPPTYGSEHIMLCELLGTPVITASTGEGGWLTSAPAKVSTNLIFASQALLAIVGFFGGLGGPVTSGSWSPDEFNSPIYPIDEYYFVEFVDCTSIPAGPITATYPYTGGVAYGLVLAYFPEAGAMGPTGPTGPSGSSEIEETLFLGYFIHGTDVSLAGLGAAKFTSPIDSFVYTSQNQILYYQAEIVSTRYPASGFVNGQMIDPGQSSTSSLPGSAGELWYFYQNVIDDPTNPYYNTLFLLQSYWNGDNEQVVNAGYAKVYAICARSL